MITGGNEGRNHEWRCWSGENVGRRP